MSTQVNSHLFNRLKIRKVINKLIMIILIIFLINPITPARADTSVCGQITGNTTWNLAGSPYIVTCLVQVMAGVRLTIQSGVRVQFDNGTSLRVDGELIAQGVTFTSNDASPANGDWGRIYFSTTIDDAVFDSNGNYLSGSMIQDSLIVFGGGGTSVTGSIVVDGASPFIDHNTVRLSSTHGIYAVGRSTDSKILISRNTVIDNNGGGIYVSNGKLISNVVSNNNGGNGAGVYATNSLLTDNQVTNNRGSWGGGIYALGSTLSDNTVSGNFGGAVGLDAYGGGIYSNGSDLTGNLVTGNSIGNSFDWDVAGGGIYANGGTIAQNTVTGNVITWGSGKGGGIYSSLSNLMGNVVSSNSVNGHHSSGGGIYSSGGNVITNTVSGNTVNCAAGEISYGGGIYSNGGTVTDNVVHNNSAAGGEDNQGGGIYGSVNTISDNALSGNSANRGGAIYSYKGTVKDNTITNNNTSLSGNIYINEGMAIGNLLQDNTAINGGGIYGYKATLIGNTVENNTANQGGGILSTESTVNGNTLIGNAAMSDGGGIYTEGGTVTNNSLTDNSVPSYGHGSGAYLIGSADFSYNDVVTNTASGGTAGGISINGQPQIHLNNLHGNQPYDAEVLSSETVSGTLNYWGPINCTTIAQRVYDGDDVPGRGQLLYAPSLYAPVPLAQLSVPTNLDIITGTTTVTLNWDDIPAIPGVGCRPPGFTGPDWGYFVHYDSDGYCPPYLGSGADQGDSPINVGQNTTLTMSSLSKGEVYFVVTAYDYLGRMSPFSNHVMKPSEWEEIRLPLILRMSQYGPSKLGL